MKRWLAAFQLFAGGACFAAAFVIYFIGNPIVATVNFGLFLLNTGNGLINLSRLEEPRL